MIKTSGSLRVLGLVYTVDASQFPRQIILIFGELSKVCVAECRRGGHFSCWSILSIARHNLSLSLSLSLSNFLQYSAQLIVLPSDSSS